MSETDEDRFDEIKKRYELKWDLSFAYFNVEDFAWLIREIKKLRESVEVLSKQANGMIIIDEYKKIESLQAELERERNTKKDAVALKLGYQAELEKLTKERDAAKDGMNKALALAKKREEMVLDWTELMAQLEAELEKVKGERDEYHADYLTSPFKDNRIEELEEEIAELKDTADHWRRQYRREESEWNERRKEISDLKKKLEASEKRCGELQGEIRHLICPHKMVSDNGVTMCLNCGWSE